jgi:Uma2 family endonuclease
MATAPVFQPDVDEELFEAAIAMPLEQYLRTTFHPDRDYVDGFAEARAMGEYDHGKVQYMLLRLLGSRESEWKIDVVPECRLQIRPGRFRILDVMVLKTDHAVHRYPTTAPLICIEVLSPEDTWARLRKVLDDYLSMGAENVWAFDPEAREAFRYGADGFRKMTELTVKGTPIHVNVAEVFSVLK